MSASLCSASGSATAARAALCRLTWMEHQANVVYQETMQAAVTAAAAAADALPTGVGSPPATVAGGERDFGGSSSKEKSSGFLGRFKSMLP